MAFSECKNKQTMKVTILLILILVTFRAATQTFQLGTVIGGTGADQANAVAVDDSANVYVTGKFSGTVDFDPSNSSYQLTSNGQTDIFVAKYNSLGFLKWAFRIGNYSGDEGNSIAVDSNGDVVVTGSFQGPADFDPGAGTVQVSPCAYNDIFIAKYTRNGEFIWAKDIYGWGYDYGYHVETGVNNQVYVCGRFTKNADFDPSANVANINSNNNSSDAFIACYSSAGDYLWAKAIGGKGSELSFSFELGENDDIFIGGYFNDTCNFNPGITDFNIPTKGQNDGFISKFDNAGNFIWAKGFGGKGDDYLNSVSVDNNDNIYVAGRYNDSVYFASSFLEAESSLDGFAASYDKFGNERFALRVGNSSYDNVVAVAANDYGNFYLTGSYFGTIDFDPSADISNLTSASGEDLYLAKYDTSGDYVSALSVGNSGAQNPLALYLDSQNNVFIPGSFYTAINLNGNNINSAGQSDIFIIKFSDLVNSIWSDKKSDELKINVFPQPAKGSVHIQSNEAGAEILSVDICDIGGRVIHCQNVNFNNAVLNLKHISKGIYIMQVRLNSGNRTMKLIIE